MARPFNVWLHAANIVTHPHSKRGYEGLIRAIYSARQPIRLRGDRHALMTSLGWSKNSNGHVLAAEGILSTFTHIDMDAPWLNVATGSAAEDRETQNIVIPPNLRPNLGQFLFRFDLQSHLLVVQGSCRMPTHLGTYKTYALGPLQVAKYFEALCAMERIAKLFARIDVTVIPDSQSVTRILDAKGLRKISLTIKPPNTEDLTKLRGRVMKRLNSMGVKTQEESFTALRSESITPDEDLRALARVAAANGRVDARIETDKGTVPISTVGEPLADKYEVNLRVESEKSAFDREAARLTKEIGSDQDD